MAPAARVRAHVRRAAETCDAALGSGRAIALRIDLQRAANEEVAGILTGDLGECAVGAQSAVSADRTAYARAKLPVTMLWGDKDTVTPIDQATDLQTLLPQATSERPRPQATRA